MEIHVQQDPKVQLRRIQAQPVLVLPAQATSHPRVLRYPLSRGKSPLTPNYHHPESLLLTDAIPRHKPHQTWEKLFRQTTTLRCRGSPELHTLFPYASQTERQNALPWQSLTLCTAKSNVCYNHIKQPIFRSKLPSLRLGIATPPPGAWRGGENPHVNIV